MFIEAVIHIAQGELAVFIYDETGGFIAVAIMLHQEKGMAVYLHVVNGVPCSHMAGNSQTGGVHVDLKIFLFLDFLLLLLFGDHGNRDNSVSELGELLRLFKELCILECKLTIQRTEAVIGQTDNGKGSGNDVVDVSVFITQSAVERLTFQLCFLVTNNTHRVLVGINCLNVAAYQSLQPFKA